MHGKLTISGIKAVLDNAGLENDNIHGWKKLGRFIFAGKGRMITSAQHQKDSLKRELVSCLEGEKEIRRIVIFGSFVKSSEPRDIDVAIFQDSSEKYLPLAMKYRKKTRAIARIIPLDIIPLKAEAGSGIFMDEIAQGEVIYER